MPKVIPKACIYEGYKHALFTITGDSSIVCTMDMLGGGEGGKYVIEETDEPVEIVRAHIDCPDCKDVLEKWKKLCNLYLTHE